MGMVGNPDTSVIGTSASNYGMPVLEAARNLPTLQVYAKEGKWKSGQWYERPSGIQTKSMVSLSLPVMVNKRQKVNLGEKITFDKVLRKRRQTVPRRRKGKKLDKDYRSLTKKSITVPSGYANVKMTSYWV